MVIAAVALGAIGIAMLSAQLGGPNLFESLGVPTGGGDESFLGIDFGPVMTALSVFLIIIAILYGTGYAIGKFPQKDTPTLLDDWVPVLFYGIVLLGMFWWGMNATGTGIYSSGGASKSTMISSNSLLIGFFGLILLYFLVYRNNMFGVKRKIKRLIGGKNPKKRKGKKGRQK